MRRHSSISVVPRMYRKTRVNLPASCSVGPCTRLAKSRTTNDRSGRSGRTHISLLMSRRNACCLSTDNFSLVSSFA
eukprot:174139-Heterocapsa_arctica.AAC.1